VSRAESAEQLVLGELRDRSSGTVDPRKAGGESKLSILGGWRLVGGERFAEDFGLGSPFLAGEAGEALSLVIV
jgi:hypothetical protein